MRGEMSINRIAGFARKKEEKITKKIDKNLGLPKTSADNNNNNIDEK